MKQIIHKNNVFSVLLAVIIGSIIYRVTPVMVDHVFNLVISKNRSNIVDIHQGRDITATQTVAVDRLNLADKNRFRHPKLGDLGYGDDFWVDVNANFLVKKAGNYVFYMGSDDGYSLAIDGHPLCEWTHDRPLTVDACTVSLTEGPHKFALVYFQGYGNSGLTMQYAYATDGTQYFAGDNSKYLKFH